MSTLSDSAKRGGSVRLEVACLGKAGFESYTLAVEVAAKSRRRKSKRLGAYKCQCGLYHIGNHRKMPRRLEE